MTAPNTRNWNAIENRQPPLDEKAVPFYVTGEVETTNGAIKPVLEFANPQGINPEILILDMSLMDSGGVGTTDIQYRNTRYDAKITKGQYTSVSIRYEGSDIASAVVQVVH